MTSKFEAPYSKEDEENYADDVTPDLTLPTSSHNSSFVDGSFSGQPDEGRCFITYVLHLTDRSPLWLRHKEGQPEHRASHYFGLKKLLVISQWQTDSVIEVSSHGKQALQNGISVKWQLLQQQGNKCCRGADRHAGVSTLCGYDYLQG